MSKQCTCHALCSCECVCGAFDAIRGMRWHKLSEEEPKKVGRYCVYYADIKEYDNRTFEFTKAEITKYVKLWKDLGVTHWLKIEKPEEER